MTQTVSYGNKNWHPGSWRNFDALQAPGWEDSAARGPLAQLQSFPALVFAGEARHLTDLLAKASQGQAFVLQAGDCSESFADFTAPNIREKLRILLQMNLILSYSTSLPIVKIGRMAGQFAKPRSSATETRDGVTLPSFRGHMVNGENFTATDRAPDPNRMVQAYFHSAATLNLLRAFSQGGFASLVNVQRWNQDFLAGSPTGKRFSGVADAISRSLGFMAACGVDLENEALTQAEVFTSHEALVLDYEQGLCRKDSLTGVWYDTSAHLLWIGERTRNLDGAHVEFLSGVANPIAVKVGPQAQADEVVALCERLNPENVPGRLSFVARMGAHKINSSLPPLLEATSSKNVAWLCDPMHGNTKTTPSGTKTRHLDDILKELGSFFVVARTHNVPPAGIHVEFTGDAVTECLGGPDSLQEHDLGSNYTTTCDPRLNARQSLELAFEVAHIINQPQRMVRDDESGDVVPVPPISPYMG